MARQTQQKRATSAKRSVKSEVADVVLPGNAPYAGHIAYYVDDSVKAAVGKLDKPMSVVVDDLLTMAVRGYRFAVEYDYANLAYHSSLFCRNRSDDNAGWILAARHSDLERAVRLLWVMQFEVFDDYIWPKSGLEGRYDW